MDDPILSEKNAGATLDAARAAFDARDRDRVAGLIHELILEGAARGAAWNTVARMASAIGAVNDAIAAHRFCIAAAPHDSSQQFALGATLVRYGRLDEATRLGERLVAQAPGSAAAHHFLGETLAQTADAERAIFFLRRAIELQPDAPISWLVLATIKRFSADDPELAQLRSACMDTRAHPGRGTLLYALGKALDDVGDVPAAFAAFEQGAQVIGQRRPYQRSADEVLLEQTTSILDRKFFERLHASTAAACRAIFIVGMPRSGTTLLEHRLIAHSQVAGGAELGAFRQAAMALTDFLPQSLRRYDDSGGDAWTRLARSYALLLEQRFGGSGRIVDKTLIHAKYLGVVAHTLPDARFIWMRRDPLATAWSCFRTHFGSGQDWSWSWDDLGYYSHLMDVLHTHWVRQFPQRIVTVSYEDFVLDPEASMRPVLAHVGLPEEAGIGNAHLNPRAVQTASTAQVRRPVDAAAVNRWRAYEPLLGEFRRAYERYGS